jgi:hypothetical protein
LKHFTAATEAFADIDLVSGTSLLLCAPKDGDTLKVTIIDTSLASGSAPVLVTAGVEDMQRVQENKNTNFFVIVKSDNS